MNYPTIEQLQSFFFRAMLSSGWIGGGDITDSTEMPGYKVVRFSDEAEGLLLIDTWCGGDEGHSSGSTTIYMRRHEERDGEPCADWIPVWTMSYMGRYDDEAIPIVKQALRVAYRTGQFIGGRGPLRLDLNGWSYSNAVRVMLTEKPFFSFAGTEEVKRRGTVYGFHNFVGMLLFDIDKDE